MNPTLRLHLVRHAKSSWTNPNLSDLQRPLNQRGLKNAPDMANQLQESGIAVTQIITSPALRALQTAAIFARETGFNPESITVIPELYEATRSQLLVGLSALQIGSGEIILVGHNPAITSLVNYLTGFTTDNMPTCAIASLELNSTCPAKAGQAKLLQYLYPKMNQQKPL